MFSVGAVQPNLRAGQEIFSRFFRIITSACGGGGGRMRERKDGGQCAPYKLPSARKKIILAILLVGSRVFVPLQ